MFKGFEAAAIIIWGVAACVLAFAFAAHEGAKGGMALAVAAAAATYVFQAAQFPVDPDDVSGRMTAVLAFLELLPLALGVASFVCTIIGV